MTLSIETITTSEAPAAIGPYSQAVRAGQMFWTSGQIPLTADGRLVEGGIEEQTHQVFRNLQADPEGSGSIFAGCCEGDGISEGYGSICGCK